MDSFELVLFLLSGFVACRGLFRWYVRLAEMWPDDRNKTTKYIFGFLPVVAFAIIVFTLTVLASFDVVDSSFYILFYILLGFAWVFLGLTLVFQFLDLSWIDDVLSLSNKAALYSITGAFLGLVIIYSGANVGDGPGWWCVVFAGGFGLVAWIFLGRVVNIFTQVLERISVERDIPCGIRFGFYLLASGIILGRASAGDWTSFAMTIVEFYVGWPVIPLTFLAIMVERYYTAKSRENRNENAITGSVFWGCIYVILAVFSVIMYPLIENPMYGNVLTEIFGALL
ncbi:MAG: hypothetical protein GX115_16870 [Ruminiclostridium sp.]|nr:hypothetical protein [Ruminiclostridium sp.]